MKATKIEILTGEEIENIPFYDLAIGCEYWVNGHDEVNVGVSYINKEGKMCNSITPSYTFMGVRPVITFNEKLNKNSIIIFGDYVFKPLDEYRAICSSITKQMAFNGDIYAENRTEYDYSNIKEYLDRFMTLFNREEEIRVLGA